MAHRPSVTTKELPSALQVLWRPMLVLALALHGLFLFMPLGAEKKELPKVTEPPVKFSRLPDIKQSAKTTTQSTPKTGPVVQKTIQRKAIISSPSSRQPVAAKSTPAGSQQASPVASKSSNSANAAATNTAITQVDKAPPKEIAKPADSATKPAPVNGQSIASLENGVTSPSATPQPTPTVSHINRAELDPETEKIIERLGDLKGRRIAKDEDLVVLFPGEQTSRFFSNLDKNEMKPEVIGVEYVTTQKLSELTDSLNRIYKDYSVKKVGEYGNGVVYEIKKDEFVRYLNFVKGKDEKDFLVVLWKKSPLKQE